MEELAANEIALFKSQKTNTWCLSNKWDFTPITDYGKLNYVDINPARGSGGTEMKINSLTIYDIMDSETVKKLSSTIEELTGKNFERSTGYDD